MIISWYLNRFRTKNTKNHIATRLPAHHTIYTWYSGRGPRNLVRKQKYIKLDPESSSCLARTFDGRSWKPPRKQQVGLRKVLVATKKSDIQIFTRFIKSRQNKIYPDYKNHAKDIRSCPNNGNLDPDIFDQTAISPATEKI